MKDLEGMTVAVTGAFGALGSIVVETLAEAGARVVAIDRLDEKVAAAPRHSVTVRGGIDLAVRDEATAVFQSIRAEIGAIQGLVNIAGGFRWESIGQGSVDTWDFLYGVNLKTALNATMAALPHFGVAPSEPRGRIVFIGAAASLAAGLGMGAYAASKAAVARLTESLAAELKDSGFTVNAILPSIIDTPANRRDMPKAEFDRWVKPHAIADLIAFLLSPKAAAINGASIPILGRV